MKTVYAIILVIGLVLGANAHPKPREINRLVLGMYLSWHYHSLIFIYPVISNSQFLGLIVSSCDDFHSSNITIKCSHPYRRVDECQICLCSVMSRFE